MNVPVVTPASVPVSAPGMVTAQTPPPQKGAAPQTIVWLIVLLGLAVLLFVIWLYVRHSPRQQPNGGNNNGNNGNGNNGNNGHNGNNGNGNNGNGANGMSQRLTIKNSCGFPVWIEKRATVRHNDQWVYGAPLPGYDDPTTRLGSGESMTVSVPDKGLPGARFWAKQGCNEQGRDCAMGDQVQYWGGFDNPDAGCPPGGCTPPVDSLLEMTFGCSPGVSECAINPANNQPLTPVDFFNVSHVDGYTLPYRVTATGDTADCSSTVLDGSKIDLDRCPSSEDLSLNGQYPEYGSVDLRIQRDGKTVACMSPCSRLSQGQPFGEGLPIGTPPTVWYCCPTPVPEDACRVEAGCVTSKACKEGPAPRSEYVRTVHEMIPGSYAYAYDDAAGTNTCPAGRANYVLEYCPAAPSPTPPSPPPIPPSPFPPGPTPSPPGPTPRPIPPSPFPPDPFPNRPRPSASSGSEHRFRPRTNR